ncbi:MAG: tetratricopeptide repeat protein [Acidobacteriota bacterium]
MRHVVLLVFFSTALSGVGALALDSSSASQQQVPPVPSAVPSSPVPHAPAEQAQTAEPQPVPQQVADAEAAISKSDWKTARADLEPWVAAHPSDARALFDLGYIADAQNRLSDAASYYRRAIAANPQSFEAHLSLGLLLAREGKLTEARPELVTATTLDPGVAGPALKARAWRALAQIDRPQPGTSGDTTQASNDLLEALKLSPETEADTLLAASLAEQAGQLDGAEAAYRRILAKDPKSELANARLGHLLILKKQYAQAELPLRTALAQTPGDPYLTAQLATALAAQNKPEAVPLLQKLHAAHPDDPAITRMLAELLADSGDPAGSDRLYAELLAAHPDEPDLLVAHGQNLVLEQKFAEAFAAFNTATEVDPTNADAWSGLAFTASKTNQPSITLHALTMRSKYLPENASTYFLWATAYDTLQRKAEAVAYYQHFLDSSAGKFPDQEWQARQRLQLLEKK